MMVVVRVCLGLAWMSGAEWSWGCEVSWAGSLGQYGYCRGRGRGMPASFSRAVCERSAGDLAKGDSIQHVH